MSKDIFVSLWIDFRGFYGMFPLQEVLGGNFVVVNENLHDEFAEFKGKVQSYIGTACCLVKEIGLLKVWCRSTEIKLKPVHVLGKTYFLMSPYDLDELCQWVKNKRSFFLIRISPLMAYWNVKNSVAAAAYHLRF